MPELPEVETIKNQLLEQILNKKIIGAEVIKPRMINVPVADFKKKIEGEKIKNIRRRAKMLIIDFSNDYSLIIHLKMTGQLIYGRETGRGTPHIIYTFVDKSQLKHYDARLFGYAKLFKTTEADDFIEERDLGPEILEKEFTLLKFEELLKQRKKSKIKPLLMDQSFIAGVGNIYAQEACFCAKVSPQRRVEALEEFEIKKIYDCLRKILVSAVKDGGTSMDSYVDAKGEKGKYIFKLKVYGKGGEGCSECGEKIKTIKLGGRGTSFCPNCQK